MSVDFYACDNCKDTFCECGDFVSCDCGKRWCSEYCAESDGYTSESCKLGYDTEDNECKDSCWDCENHLDSTCNYCRHEDFEDKTLLDYALQLLGMNREYLIKQYNKYNNK